MRIGLTYDLQTDPHDERQAEFDPPRTIVSLTRALTELGHEVLPLGNTQALLAQPRRVAGVDLVFNLAEGSHGRCREAWVPTLLELFKVPYVGSDPLALSLGLDKAMSKRLAAACGIATPRWITVEDPRAIPAVLPLAFPVIVKPRDEGSGIGIDEGAVVHDHAALVGRVRWLFERWQEPIVIEAFIPDGELTVCVIGNDPPTAYPAVQRPLDPRSRLSCHVVNPVPPRDRHGFGKEDICGAIPSGVPAVRSGASSWDGVKAHSAVTREWDTPLALSEELDAAARRIALVMFEALGCRDMARIDLRVDAAGTVYFLEINPLPSLDPEGSFGLLAEHRGIPYTHLIGRIIDAARGRIAARPAASHEAVP